MSSQVASGFVSLVDDRTGRQSRRFRFGHNLNIIFQDGCNDWKNSARNDSTTYFFAATSTDEDHTLQSQGPFPSGKKLEFLFICRRIKGFLC